MEVGGEDAYRLFYQSLEKVKHQLNPAAKQLIREQLTEQEINQERLLHIIHQQFGDCNILLLVFTLALLTMSNHETFITYQKVFNEGSSATAPHPSKREGKLEEQLIDIQKKLGKLQKENEQVRYKGCIK